jgi:two-component system, chemotaxis family, protein-glutamate methylesterase/glutaminase
MKTIRVLILDDSHICRVQLRSIVEADGDIKVVGEAGNGDKVLQLIEKTEPQVLLVDLEMPGTPGHATIERVMADHPLPILVVTGVPSGRRQAEVFEAIRRGALQLAAKPTLGDRVAEAGLRAQVRQLAGIPVVRHMAGRKHRVSAVEHPSVLPLPPSGDSALPLIIGVGASAGGPMALAAMLADLPPSLNAAIAVVQHLPNGFTHAFAQFLQGRVRLPVQVVEGSVRPECGRIYVAPDDRHLILERRRFAPANAPPIEGHRPSVDALFRSLATECQSRSTGVLMSGMGRDGVDGLLRMRQAGALTLAQDEASCGVFGMPMSAIKDGAVSAAHPPPVLARVVEEWCRSSAQQGATP